MMQAEIQPNVTTVEGLRVTGTHSPTTVVFPQFSLHTCSLIIFKISVKLTFCLLQALMNRRDRMPQCLKILSLKTSFRDSEYSAWSGVESRHYYNLFQNVLIYIRFQDSSGDKLITLGIIHNFLIIGNSGMNTSGQ